MNEVFDPDHVYVPTTRAIDTEEYRGGRGYLLGGTLGSFEVSLIPHQSGITCAVTAARFHGTGSGVEFEQRIWVVMTVRNGRICRTESYTDPTEALKAALSEQDAHADS